MKKIVTILVLTAAVLLSGTVKAGGLLNNLDVTFYGYIKAEATYQDAKANGNNFITVAMPANLHDGMLTTTGAYVKNSDDPNFGITARQTRFGFKIKGPTFGKDGQLLGRIEGDFYGQGGGAPVTVITPSGASYAGTTSIFETECKGNFMLRIATVEMRTKYFGILAGNDWMVMSPLAPRVSNYTAQAELGNLGYRMPQIRFTGYLLDGKLQAQVAANSKIGDFGGNGVFAVGDIDTGRNSGAPDVQYGIVWDSKLNDLPLKLGFTGHYGKEVFGGLYNPSVNSYSYNVHASIPVTKWLALSGEWYTGANLDGFYTGAQGRGWVVMKSDGEFESLEDTGGWGEVMIGPFKGFQIYGGYSIDDVDDDQLKKAAAVSNGKPIWTQVTKNQAFWVDLHYWVVPKVADISFEYMNVNTEYGLGTVAYGAPYKLDDGTVDRFNLAFWLYF